MPDRIAISPEVTCTVIYKFLLVEIQKVTNLAVNVHFAPVGVVPMDLDRQVIETLKQMAAEIVLLKAPELGLAFAGLVTVDMLTKKLYTQSEQPPKINQLRSGHVSVMYEEHAFGHKTTRELRAESPVK
jgi:hypothetical protein